MGCTRNTEDAISSIGGTKEVLFVHCTIWSAPESAVWQLYPYTWLYLVDERAKSRHVHTEQGLPLNLSEWKSMQRFKSVCHGWHFALCFEPQPWWRNAVSGRTHSWLYQLLLHCGFEANVFCRVFVYFNVRKKKYTVWIRLIVTTTTMQLKNFSISIPAPYWVALGQPLAAAVFSGGIFI